jgi:hypothetical protein
MIATIAALALAAAIMGEALPNGTYHYLLYAGDKQSATSTIGIYRDANGVRIDEQTFSSGEQINTIRTLNATTFSATLYRVTLHGSNEIMAATPTGADYHAGDKATTLAQLTPGPAMMLDSFVGAYAGLPAMVAATSAQKFNVYCVCAAGATASLATVVPTTATRPEDLPHNDRSLSLTVDAGTITLWYDPTTFILHELDAPDSHLKIVRSQS